MNTPSSGHRLWLYRGLERLGWPRSYPGKLFLVAFIAVHLPLLALLGFSLLSPFNPLQEPLFWLILFTTLSGCSLLLWALHQLLQPVLLAIQGLRVYFTTGRVLPLPSGFQDEVGWLLNNVAFAIHSSEQQRRVLEQLAAEDFLTGLLNRRAANDKLQESFSLAERNGLPLCLALVDIDRFKQLNDRYGHEVGDEALVRLGQYLKQTFRESDWAARWGGEEFLIVLFAEPEGTRVALERLREQVAQLGIPHDGGSVNMTVSIGFTAVHPLEPAQEAVRRADAALYQAKRAGRNRVVAR